MHKGLALTVLTVHLALASDRYLYGEDCQCDSLHRDFYDGTDLVFSEIPYINGKQHGVARAYYMAGGPLIYTGIEGDVLQGRESRYYMDGSLLSASTYKDGLLDGMLITYYRSGQVLSECQYHHGKLDGWCTEYYLDGRQASTAEYREDTLVGHKRCTDGRAGHEGLDCLH